MSEISQEEQDQLVELLEKCTVVNDPQLRATIVRRLPERIRPHLIEDARTQRAFLANLVQSCASFAGGIADLRDAVSFLEGDTYDMQVIEQFLSRVLTDGVSNSSSSSETHPTSDPRIHTSTVGEQASKLSNHFAADSAYNLIVTSSSRAWEYESGYNLDKSRFLEYTDAHVKERLHLLDKDAVHTLCLLPTLFAYEGKIAKPARVGYIKNIRTRPNLIRISFEFMDSLPQIPPSEIDLLKDALDIGAWEMERTHWAVKEGDLLGLLHSHLRDNPANISYVNMTLGGNQPVNDIEEPQLTKQLQDAIVRKRRLEQTGIAADDILEEILELKRKLRYGGRLRKGDLLGNRYILLEQVGRGGFATVWKCQNQDSGDAVAVKVLHSELSGDIVRRQRFFRGARIMASLDHLGIVRIIEQEAEDDGFYYLVMEYVSGGNLEELVATRQIHENEAIAIALHVGTALTTAHDAGLWHRDVKPANILFTNTGEPQLTDFDLVAAQDTTGGTRTGALGTFIYAAPEMMERPQDADHCADVYGLGMTIIFMLHGSKLPRQALMNRSQFISQLQCRPSIRSILKQATAEDTKDRLRSIDEFCTALQDAMEKPMSAINLRESSDTDVDFDPFALVQLEGGGFWMGSTNQDSMADDDERPRHQVSLSPFLCMAYPVTRLLWDDVIGKDYIIPPQESDKKIPVSHVSWMDAVEFCNQLSQREGLPTCYRITEDAVIWLSSDGYRLPTEAEWEYACRAGTSTPWCCGESWQELAYYAWYKANSDSPQPVGKKRANAWGLYDMHGNVWEWCWDQYAPYRPQTGTMFNQAPLDPSIGGDRVLRGGSVLGRPSSLRCANRYHGYEPPGARGGYFGFRCVRSLQSN